MRGGGYTARPSALHEHATRIGGRAEQVGQVGSGLGGAALPAGALGLIGRSTAARHQGFVADATRTVQRASQSLHGQADRMHATGRSITEVDDDHAERFGRLGTRAPEVPRPHATSRPSSRPTAPQRPSSPFTSPGYPHLKLRDFTLNTSSGQVHVSSSSIHDGNGNLVGLSSINDPKDQAAQNWAVALGGQHATLTDYYHGHSTPGRPNATQPVGGMAHSMLADAHADKHGFQARVNGQDVMLDGRRYAELVHSNPDFAALENAGRTRNIFLSSCGAAGRGGTAAQQFTDRMAELTGHEVTTYGGTGTVWIGGSQNNALLGTEGRWITHHAAPGAPPKAVNTAWQ